MCEFFEIIDVICSQYSNVKDITAVLECTVYDQDRNHVVEFLGKVAIPLINIENGIKRWYTLKDKECRYRAKGKSPQVYN